MRLALTQQREAIQLYKNGLSQAEVGRRFGVTYQAIQRLLKTRRVPRRNWVKAGKSVNREKLNSCPRLLKR
jgi:transposase